MLLQEAQIRKNKVSEDISTVYIGGGTPSLLSSGQLRKLITGLDSVFDLTRVCEFTIEANPGTVTNDWLDTAVSLGVNRISFGMQAFQASLLQQLGRIHTFNDVEKSVFHARESGIENISLDLIFGIPDQTLTDWNETTDAALSLAPSHLSAYGLIPEEGTPLYSDLINDRLELPDPETEREMYDAFIKKTGLSGFSQYEISNFAKDGKECLHNIGYWTQIPYLGLGVSAASMTDVRYNSYGMSYIRSVNPNTLAAYKKAICTGFRAEQEQVVPQESRFETMMLGLRMNRGVSDTEFLTKHHLTIQQCFGKKLSALEQNSLIIHETGFWKLTPRGFDIQNSVLVELMDD